MRNSAALILLLLFCLLPFYFCLPSSSQSETAADLHRWGAVTLFHGLPSDQVRAVAQGRDGSMWFGTDAGLARYDGRRIQTVTDEGLTARRVNVLRFDAGGSLWAGTDDGAYVRAQDSGVFVAVKGTKGKHVTALATPEADRALLATKDGLLFECRRRGGAPSAEAVGEPLTAAAGKAQPLKLTSVASLGDTIAVGTSGRGLMTVGPDGEAKEVLSRPRAFFVTAIERHESGALAFGAQTSVADGGVYKAEADRLARPTKLSGATGGVNALAFSDDGDLYAGTEGRGVFRYRGDRLVEHFTFAGTAGGLRSDSVNAVFVDREGVVWFGTNRGVCRYDPQGVRAEQLSAETEGNFVRSLFRTSRGRLLVGTNRGLFVSEGEASSEPRRWKAVEEMTGKTVYSVAEDASGRLLVGTGVGLYVGLQSDARAPDGAPVKFAPEEKVSGAKPEAKGGEEKVKADAVEPSPSPAEQKSVELDAAGNEKSVREEKAAVKKSAEPALSGSVRAIASFGGAVYVASFGRGVERFDGPSRRTLVWPRQADDARGREVVSLFADASRGRLWIGTANAGAFYFDGREVKAEPALSTLSASTVWGFGGADGWLWVATNRGLYAFKEGGELVEVAPGVDARGVVAIASSGASASAQNTSARTQGVPRAWCATAGVGVIKVALDEEFGPVKSRLDSEHGLPTQSAFAVLPVAAEEGGGGRASLLIGTTRGLVRYEPGALPPDLKLTRVTASRSHQPEELRGGALRLEYPQDGLVLDVAATASRTFPEQFQYAFILHDAEGRAIKRKLSHDSQFQAEALKAGTYRVTARAYTLDLVASEPLHFEFVVARAPFPRTILLLSVLLALALVALLWAYFQHRKIVRSREDLREANSQLAAARMQLANEAESERRRIARDLHDQTLADLRRLLLLTDEMQQGGNGGVVLPSGGLPTATTTAAATNTAVVDPSALRAEIESISQEIRRICEDLSPSVLENVGFAAALEFALSSALAHLPPDCKFAYDFACDDHLEERLSFAPGVQMQIYRIVQEAVSNVCRHAHATRVSMSVRLDDEGDFVLKLEDDGQGFDLANKKSPPPGGRGISGIKARAALIDAQVSWAKRPDTEGGGTTFTLRKHSTQQNRER